MFKTLLERLKSPQPTRRAKTSPNAGLVSPKQTVLPPPEIVLPMPLPPGTFSSGVGVREMPTYNQESFETPGIGLVFDYGRRRTF